MFLNASRTKPCGKFDGKSNNGSDRNTWSQGGDHPYAILFYFSRRDPKFAVLDAGGVKLVMIGDLNIIVFANYLIKLYFV